jgi:SAM-dependent methyltransferase
LAYAIKNILINRIHDRAVMDCAARYLGGRLIDIGCGSKPYAKRLAPFVRDHVGVDHAASPHGNDGADLIGTAYEIPAEPGSFDCSICTAVLEHLEEPARAIAECHRVLKDGGVAIYTVPFIWHLHEEPRDFYRFSKYGLRFLFEKAGFGVIEIRALSGFFVTFSTLLSYYISRLNHGPLRWLRIIDLLCLCIQFGGWGLDRLSRDERYTWMYLVVARKGRAS